MPNGGQRDRRLPRCERMGRRNGVSGCRSKDWHSNPLAAGPGRQEQDGANRTRLVGLERNGTGTPNLRRAGSSCRPAEPPHSEFLKHQPVFLSPIQAILERQALDDLKKILKKKGKRCLPVLYCSVHHWTMTYVIRFFFCSDNMSLSCFVQ